MLLWMGEVEGEGEGEGEGEENLGGEEGREIVSDFWFFFLLDDVLTFGKKGRGIEDVWVWFEEDGHSIQPS